MKQNKETFRGIIITGSPGSGKTTLINELAKFGYKVHEEAARRIIKQQLELGTDAVPWKDIHAFSLLAKELMMQEFPSDAFGTQFFDRGVPDLMAYFSAGGHTIESSYFEALTRLNYYKKVLILPPWEEIYSTDTERKESFEKACEVFEALKKTYEDLGFELIEVPRLYVAERIQFVLRAV